MGNATKVMTKVLVVGLVLATSSSVYAKRFGDRGHRGQGHKESPAYSNVQSFTQSEYIGQQVQDGDKVFLGRAFKLHRQHEGQEVDTIKVNIQGMRRGGSATLLVNGQRAGRIKDFRGRRAGEQTLRWTLPNKTLIVGENLRSLQVEFEGEGLVTDATLTFVDQPQRGGYGRPQSFTQSEYIGQQVKADDKVFLGRAFKLHKQHEGQEVDTIEIDVEGQRRNGVAILLVNGQRAGQIKNFGGRRAGEQTLRWTLPNKTLIVGGNLRSLQVQFEGKAFVMEATLTFIEQPQRRGHGHDRAPRPMRPFITNVQQDFFGGRDVALANLISANYNQYQIQTNKVALQLQGSSFRASAKLCKMDQPWVCGQTKFIGFRDNLLELDAPMNSKVGELVLKTGGQFSISQVVVYPSH